MIRRASINADTRSRGIYNGDDVEVLLEMLNKDFAETDDSYAWKLKDLKNEKEHDCNLCVDCTAIL